MSRPNKQKIPTQTPASSGLGGLDQAFAGLNIPSLPEPAPPFEPKTVPAATPTKRGRVVLRRETAHRGGKTVIIVDGFDPAIDDEAIETLGKRLRAACGCGGSTKNRALELQGNQPDRIRAWLVGEGFRVDGIR